MSDIKKIREALFSELDKLNSEEVKASSEKLYQAIDHAEAVSKVCAVILESAKLEHNFMKMTERATPYTNFIPVDDNNPEMTAEYYARLAASKRRAWVERNLSPAPVLVVERNVDKSA